MVKHGDYESVLGVRRYRVGVKRAVLFKAQGGRVPVRGWFLVNGDEGFCLLQCVLALLQQALSISLVV